MLESEIPDFIKGRFTQKNYENIEKGRAKNLPMSNFQDKYITARTSYSTSSLFNHYKSQNLISVREMNLPLLKKDHCNKSNKATTDTFYKSFTNNLSNGTAANRRKFFTTEGEELEDDFMFNFTSKEKTKPLKVEKVKSVKDFTTSHTKIRLKSQRKTARQKEYEELMDKLKKKELENSWDS